MSSSLNIDTLFPVSRGITNEHDYMVSLSQVLRTKLVHQNIQLIYHYSLSLSLVCMYTFSWTSLSGPPFYTLNVPEFSTHLRTKNRSSARNTTRP